MGLTLFDFTTVVTPDDRVGAITRGEVTATFRPAAIIIPLAGPDMPPRALANGGQDPHDEVGHQKPMMIEFNRLQSRVSVWVGLEEPDLSVPQVQATVRAFNSAGREITLVRGTLGRGPLSPGTVLTVRASTDIIARVRIEYSGLLRELVAQMEVEAVGDVVNPPDTTAPIVRIVDPADGQQTLDPTVDVRGRITEANQIASFELNGIATPVRRVSETEWEFTGSVVLTDPDPVIRARAVDGGGNVGETRLRMDLATAITATVEDVRLTQHGVMSGDAVPSRLIAGKSAMVRLIPRLLTRDGRATSVDAASIELASQGTASTFSEGFRRPGADGRFTSPGGPFRDGEPIYFFLDGHHLRANRPFQLVVRLGGRSYRTLEQVIATNQVFRTVRGLTMLVQPQHRALEPDQVAALQWVLFEMARMYPVPDGVSNLAEDFQTGVRFALLDPLSYDGHTDPADAAWTRHREIPYDQGFLLVDHEVAADPGPDGRWGTGDEPTTFWAGEFLPINFTAAEDGDRDGRIDAEERRHTTNGDTGRRLENWDRFSRQNAAAALQRWNSQQLFTHQARRTIVILTDGETGQNRTPWVGNASNGELSFWACIGVAIRGAFLPHEVGHNLGLVHAEDGVNPLPGEPGPCEIAVESVNLLTRTMVTSAARTMCSGVGAAATHFFSPSEYERLLDVLITGRRN